MNLVVLNFIFYVMCRLDLQVMMLPGQFSQVLSAGPATLVSWLGWDRRMPMWVMKLSLKEVS